MNRVKAAVCMGDRAYGDRLISCLMKYYRRQLELYVFENWEQLEKENKTYDLILTTDCEKVLEGHRSRAEPVVCLCDLMEQREQEGLEKNIYFVEKYQEVGKIVEQMLVHMPEEVRSLGQIESGTKIAAVYSLSENEYQLPFAVTLGSILGELGQVLLIDLQENSGITQVMEQDGELGLEELLIMAENGSGSKSRIVSCIGHANGMDYIYPVENTESLCETDGETYLRLFSMLSAELKYDLLILNLGARFSGFAKVLKRCDNIYLVQRNGGSCQWREYELMEELRRRGYQDVAERLTRVELPVMTCPVSSFERLVEQWKWNELGDLIRRIAPQVPSHG